MLPWDAKKAADFEADTLHSHRDGFQSSLASTASGAIAFRPPAPSSVNAIINLYICSRLSQKPALLKAERGGSEGDGGGPVSAPKLQMAG